MDWKYIFEKTELPGWALGIFVSFFLTLKGTISLGIGGGFLCAFGTAVYFIYRNEVHATRIPAIMTIACGVVFLLIELIGGAFAI